MALPSAFFKTSLARLHLRQTLRDQDALMLGLSLLVVLMVRARRGRELQTTLWVLWTTVRKPVGLP